MTTPSKILDWFTKDFGMNDEELLQFVANFLPEELAAAIEANPKKWQIKHTKYDWSLMNSLILLIVLHFRRFFNLRQFIKTYCIITFLSTHLFIAVSTSLAQPISLKLLGDFEEGWSHHWMARKFTSGFTHYEVVEEDGNLVLMAHSKRSASGLWHMLDIHPGKVGKISWRWKVAKSLSNKKEKKKRGDDYAARLFVVFEPHFLNWKTRAICYVWAGHEPVGSVYKNPYSKSVATFVIESGNEQSGQWIFEERDFIEDYRNYFGEAPEMVSAVAVMSDTDNTGEETKAWFDDIVLKLSEPEHERK